VICMKKRVAMCIFPVIVVLSLFMVAAANESYDNAGISSQTLSPVDENSAVNKAYQCLESQIANKSNFALQEAIFGVLALGSKNNLVSIIQNNKQATEACWPKGGCKIKESAQVALAYERIGSSTNDVKQWLISKKALPNDLQWYLEIDVAQHVPASCNVKYDGRDYKISVQNDMTLSGSAGSCLSLSNSGYWLRINNNCLAKSFEISCDQDFITTLLYQKSGGSTVYVSPTTHSAPSLGITNESVRVSCLKNTPSGACDYEGTLWGALALQKINVDVSDIIPYLVALSDENSKLFPSSFLYILTGDEEYYSAIIEMRKNGQYWEVLNTLYNRYHDTSLAMLSLSSSSSSLSEIDRTKSYLLGIQTNQGCWNNNNIKDTAFLLYSAWPRRTEGTSTGGSSLIACVEAGFSCERLSECTEAGGVKREGYDCPSGASICCSVKVERESCQAQNGNICQTDEICDGQAIESGEGACCIGFCVPAPIASNVCEDLGGSCLDSCGDNQEESSESCSNNQICCIGIKSSGFGKIWIIILILLIVIVALGIFFRDKLRLWWFTKRGKSSASPVTRTGMPPRGPPGETRLPPRMQPMFAQRNRLPIGGEKDKDMDDTMRKLREMSR